MNWHFRCHAVPDTASNTPLGDSCSYLRQVNPQAYLTPACQQTGQAGVTG